MNSKSYNNFADYWHLRVNYNVHEITSSKTTNAWNLKRLFVNNPTIIIISYRHLLLKCWEEGEEEYLTFLDVLNYRRSIFFFFYNMDYMLYKTVKFVTHEFLNVLYIFCSIHQCVFCRLNCQFAFSLMRTFKALPVAYRAALLYHAAPYEWATQTSASSYES